jgi:glutamyl-Q tRNA(Asp) synthetase
VIVRTEPASAVVADAPYVGRFAPSPTGPLHAGSLVAALASWLDARAHGGRWLLRIEDVDRPRCVAGVGGEIERQLHTLGLLPDAPPEWQSERGALYQAALDRLITDRRVFPCSCTRQQIAAANLALGRPAHRHGELVYPGTCRPEHGGLRGKLARAWRLRVPDGDDALLRWHDRRLGAQEQRLDTAVGDFVLKRADGLWAYQLAVVVDDALQGVTDVVRGEDLADNTPRQIHLQAALGVPTPRYLHTPLVRAPDGEKLSKQHGAPALDLRDPLATLRAAGAVLGLQHTAASAPAWLALAVAVWGEQQLRSG